MRIAAPTSLSLANAALAASALLFAAGCAGSNRTCTSLGCGAQGVNVDFSYKDVGTYVVDVTVDGTKHECTATIPLPRGAPNDACVAAGIYLMRVGSEMPVEQQSIGGLTIATTKARAIALKITRDGQLLREASFSPAYKVTPGPNGPDCEPKECTSATFTLP